MTWRLIAHWKGVSSEEIAERLRDRTTAEEVDRLIANDKERLEKTALEKIIKRAGDGEASAVDWLESRGCINLLGR